MKQTRWTETYRDGTPKPKPSCTCGAEFESVQACRKHVREHPENVARAADEAYRKSKVQA